MTAHQIEALKALALAMPPGKAQPYVTAMGGIVILNGPFPVPQAKRIADYIAAANPTTILELIAELDRLKLERDTLDRDCALGAKRINEAADLVERLRAEKERAAQDSFALAWSGALSDAAFYVAGHCANGERHAEIIMEMVAPKLKIIGGQLDGSKTAETRMDASFEGGHLAAPAAGTEKDAARYRKIKADNARNADDTFCLFLDLDGNLLPIASVDMDREIDAAITAHTNAKEPS